MNLDFFIKLDLAVAVIACSALVIVALIALATSKSDPGSKTSRTPDAFQQYVDIRRALTQSVIRRQHGTTYLSNGYDPYNTYDLGRNGNVQDNRESDAHRELARWVRNVPAASGRVRDRPYCRRCCSCHYDYEYCRPLPSRPSVDR